MSQSPDTAPLYVSVVNEFPEDLYEAMRRFVQHHPSWDQYRLMQVALAGFLFQQGSRDRAVSRHYLDGLFDRGQLDRGQFDRGQAGGESGARGGPQRPAATPPPEPAGSRCGTSRRAMAPMPPGMPAVMPPVPHAPGRLVPSVSPHPGERGG